MPSLFKSPKIPTPPPIKPPEPMPDQTSIDEAKKKAVIAQQQRSGRQSTLLSQSEGL